MINDVSQLLVLLKFYSYQIKLIWICCCCFLFIVFFAFQLDWSIKLIKSKAEYPYCSLFNVCWMEHTRSVSLWYYLTVLLHVSLCLWRSFLYPLPFCGSRDEKELAYLQVFASWGNYQHSLFLVLTVPFIAFV